MVLIDYLSSFKRCFCGRYIVLLVLSVLKKVLWEILAGQGPVSMKPGHAGLRTVDNVALYKL